MPAGFLRSRGVDPVEIVIVVSVFGRTELALHDHATALVAQIAELLALDRTQHAVDALATAAAARDKGTAGEQTQPFGMEQPMPQGRARPPCVQDLGMRCRAQ